MSAHAPVCELLGIEHPIVCAAGQSVALAKQRQPAAERVAELVSGL